MGVEIWGSEEDRVGWWEILGFDLIEGSRFRFQMREVILAV